MEFNFSGKRVVITGATRGIGRATARLLHKLGATVIAVCCNQQFLDELLVELPGIELLNVNLSNWELGKAALASVGPIDLLVNNVGTCAPSSILDASEEGFNLLSDVNLKSTFVVSQVAAQSMVDRGTGGAIVNVASVLSFTPLKTLTIYSALKAATVNLTKSMALDLAKHKIRVNAVAPGVVNTQMSKVVDENDDVKNRMMSKLPIPVFIEPEEIAKAISFLLSDHASVITGVTLPVDAGYLLNPPLAEDM